MEEKFSKVNVRGSSERVRVKITSEDKPAIPDDVVEKWQSILDSSADIIGVPSALIMKLQPETIKVFMKSNGTENPYHVNEEAELKYGLYCETVIGRQKPLIVPDAKNDLLWKDNNPDVDIDMISYMGVPLNWPDGEVFGTVCVLDKKYNAYNDRFSLFLEKIKDSLEKDLSILLYQKKIESKNDQLENANFIKSKFLSLISHDVRGSISSIDEFLTLLLEDYDRFDKETIKSYLISIKESSKATYDTLENLLAWSKQDMMGVKPNFQMVDLVAITERVIRYFSQSLKLKGIKVRKSFVADKVTICLDENMFETALRNIFSNAIKYSLPNGIIDINISEVEDGRIKLEIRDYGVGMHEDTLARLFSYDKYHKKGTGGEISSGLGLLLTKEFLDKNNAEVEVESQMEKGTTFFILI